MISQALFDVIQFQIPQQDQEPQTARPHNTQNLIELKYQIPSQNPKLK